jgi:hypothetical protein
VDKGIQERLGTHREKQKKKLEASEQLEWMQITLQMIKQEHLIML